MAETTSVEWTSKVFAAMSTVASGRLAGVSLSAVGIELGIQPDEMTEQLLTATEGVGAALFQAMSDLDSIGLIDFQNVSYGNTLTQLGRDAADVGIHQLWPRFFDIHLGERASAFLGKLVELSVRRRYGWVERHSVPAKQVFAELGWEGATDYDHNQDIHELVNELHTKGMVGTSGAGNFGNIDVTPTYSAVVRMTMQDPRAAGVTAGILDWSRPAPGWEGVEADLLEIKRSADAAATEHDFEDLGRRVREVAADAVMLVAKESMVPNGKVSPGPRDAKAWLDIYLESEFSGGSNTEFRGFLRATLALANAVAHGTRHRVVGAVASIQGLVTLVRTLEAIDRQSEPRDG